MELNFPPHRTRESLAAAAQPSTSVTQKPQLERQGLRLLPGMTFESLGVQIHTQLAGATRAQLVLGQHAKDGLAHDQVSALGPESLHGDFLEPPRVAAVAAVHLLF